MLRFRTEGYNGYSLQFSPFFESKISCATAANFGLVGNGRLFILNTGVGPNGVEIERIYDTKDGLYDCSWSEVNENQVVTASGDGSIMLWDTTLMDFPIKKWKEHQREVYSVHWNLIKKDSFWHPEAPQSLSTFSEHTACVYSTIWSPYNPDVFGSASGDSTFKIWDVKVPRSAQTIRAHHSEILSLDWNKYQENVIVTGGSVDRILKVWDLRSLNREITCLRGHRYAIRRVKCSPHDGNIIASASYDMTVRLWNTTLIDPLGKYLLVLGMNMYIYGILAS
ncbi:20627_t:CDS:2 [Racocetra persica]|uniref:20627_t:CDS:1 n=1 Tax=Racocetra persica TaxID=160502 RepID=A0ACA9LW93_9GLOM|nr:20627_t:CDS:2 [Racocetra persica]